MTYPDLTIEPMRRELTQIGFRDLRTPEEVDRFMAESKDGVALLVVNSVCGCARGTMRPALAMVLSQSARPDALGTVFAGQDGEATTRARDYFAGYTPSSPAVALFRKGELCLMIQRPAIKGQHPAMLADELGTAIRQALGDEEAA